jgi:hypothetical protein
MIARVLLGSRGQARGWATFPTIDRVETQTQSSARRNDSGRIECGKVYFKALAIGGRPRELIPGGNIDDLMAS